MNDKKIKFWKILMGFFIILLILGIITYMVPVLKNLNTQEGQALFRDKINDAGILGLLWLLGIQIAQIFLVLVPGEPIEILAGMCYGGLWGTIFIMISATIISTTIFLLVRKYGKRFVCNFCDKEKVEKIENSNFFQNPQKIEKILLILFLIPGTPKDFLAYVSGLLPIKPLHYIVISSLARFPSVISSTLAGENIITGKWQYGVLIYAITFVVIALSVFIMNKFDKSKVTEETINNWKEKQF